MKSNLKYILLELRYNYAWWLKSKCFYMIENMCLKGKKEKLIEVDVGGTPIPMLFIQLTSLCYAMNKEKNMHTIFTSLN